MSFKAILQIEAQVRWVNKYSPKEIKVLLRTHPNDFTPEIEASFFDLKDSWKTFRLVLMEEVEDGPIPVLEVACDRVWIQTDDPWIGENNSPPKERDPMAVKRQSLALNIKTYASQHNTNEQTVKEALYSHFQVKSRSELTDEQLDLALVKYKPLHPSEVDYYLNN